MHPAHRLKSPRLLPLLHRYPETYVPPPTAVHPKKITVNVKLMGAGLDGLQVPVTVKSTGTVAEVITSEDRGSYVDSFVLPCH